MVALIRAGHAPGGNGFELYNNYKNEMPATYKLLVINHNSCAWCLKLILDTLIHILKEYRFNFIIILWEFETVTKGSYILI